MAKLTYDTKEDRLGSDLQAKYIFRAQDANEVKASVNAIYDLLADVVLRDVLIVSPSDFSGMNYQNGKLVNLTPFVHFEVFSNDGGGLQLSIGTTDAEYYDGAGCIYTAAQGKLKMNPGYYVIKIFKKLIP